MALALSGIRFCSMRTIVYVDGFNLYYRLLQKRPDLRWLNIKDLSETVLNQENNIICVKYFTARVSGKIKADSPAKQSVYLSALGTVPEIDIFYGNFLVQKKWAFLLKPPKFKPNDAHIEMNDPYPNVVKVRKVEEKGSDVNLASHLLMDAFQNKFDVAAVLSNDSDLVEPIRMCRDILNKTVGILSPVSNPEENLRSSSSFIRRIENRHLNSSQFPEIILKSDGSEIKKPSSWV